MVLTFLQLWTHIYCGKHPYHKIYLYIRINHIWESWNTCYVIVYDSRSKLTSAESQQLIREYEWHFSMYFCTMLTIIQWSCREGREILEIGFVQNDWSGENETHVLPSQTEDNSNFNSQSSSSRTAYGSNVSGMVINYHQTWNQQIQIGVWQENSSPFFFTGEPA